MAKMTDVPGDTDYSSGVKKTLILGKDGKNMASPANPLPVDAVISVDTMNLTAEMKVDSGHDLYEATNIVRTANLAVSFDAVVGLTLAKIQSIENKTKGWVYNTKGATVTNTTITLVAANQNAGYPVMVVGDEIEVIYRGASRFTDGTQITQAYGVYNATEPILSDGDKVPLQTDSKGKLYVNSGASGVSGGGLSLYVLDSGNTLGHGAIVYTSGATCTISGNPFTLSANLISKLDRIDNTGKLVATYTLADTAMTISSNVLSVSGMSAAATDTFVLYIMGSERTNDISTDAQKTISLVNVWNRYTDPETLVTAQDLTNAYADYGAEIDMRGYNRLGVYIVTDVNDSETVNLQVLGKHTAEGTDEYTIDGISEKALWTTGASDAKLYYEFDVGTIPFIQLQAKAGTVGATAGDLSITINKVFRS